MTQGIFRSTLEHLRRLIIDEQSQRALNLIDVILKSHNVEMSGTVTERINEARQAGAQKIATLVEKTTAKIIAGAKMTPR